MELSSPIWHPSSRVVSSSWVSGAGGRVGWLAPLPMAKNVPTSQSNEPKARSWFWDQASQHHQDILVFYSFPLWASWKNSAESGSRRGSESRHVSRDLQSCPTSWQKSVKFCLPLWQKSQGSPRLNVPLKRWPSLSEVTWLLEAEIVLNLLHATANNGKCHPCRRCTDTHWWRELTKTPIWRYLEIPVEAGHME